VSAKGLFLQNVIALIWDFDRTLSPHYMQAPLFKAYGIDEKAFWREVNSLPAHYAKAGIQVQRDTCYLGHLLSYVQSGRMPGLTNARLRELGGEITFFPGVPDIFARLKAILSEDRFRHSDLKLEHYIVSTGLAEMIRGSAVAPHIEGVWASEFIETPAPPGYDPAVPPPGGPISQIAGLLDNTTKTRAIFEINKGVNVEPSFKVNDNIAEEERRVLMRNMIYIADGPSDIPSFSVVRKHGGLAYAVYAPDDDDQFKQVNGLLENKRVDAYGPADYTEGSQTYKWLRLMVSRIADRIMTERKQASQSRVGKEPVHLDDPVS
jgi:hypothetical protein